MLKYIRGLFRISSPGDFPGKYEPQILSAFRDFPSEKNKTEITGIKTDLSLVILLSSSSQIQLRLFVLLHISLYLGKG
ncbi:hypothetical protein Bca4012_073073 [Brassica carinata]